MLAPEVMVPLPSGIQESLLQVGDEIQRRALEIVKKLDLNVEGKIAFGSAASEILREADGGGYDLIILGSRGHGAVEDFLIGSVGTKVAHNAPCSVLLVR